MEVDFLVHVGTAMDISAASEYFIVCHRLFSQQ